MKEIGGYMELEKYTLSMLHENAIKLNCGRNALAYIIRARKIKKIYIPRFLCGCIESVCKKENVEVSYYSVGMDFLPVDIEVEDGSYLYLVNYYGQISNEIIKEYSIKYKNLIVDNAQAYFQMPVDGIDTIYTCRKFFGVSDGAILYTDAILQENIEKDMSYNRMNFVLGRFEKGASEFYKEASENNDFFDNEPIKEMSPITENLLRAVNYEEIKNKRTENFIFLHENLNCINNLNLNIPQGAFMYPLYIENGDEMRKILQQKKIYIPTLWPDVFDVCDEKSIEYHMSKNILPLPVDQRYNEKDMYYIIECLKK